MLKQDLEVLVAKQAAEIAALKAELNALRKQPTSAKQEGEVITHTYTKSDGSRWNKVRIGFGQFVHRPVMDASVTAGGPPWDM